MTVPKGTVVWNPDKELKALGSIFRKTISRSVESGQGIESEKPLRIAESYTPLVESGQGIESLRL